MTETTESRLAVVAAQLDGVVAELHSIAATLAHLPSEMEKKYLPRELAAASQHLQNAQLADVRRDIAALRADQQHHAEEVERWQREHTAETREERHRSDDRVAGLRNVVFVAILTVIGAVITDLILRGIHP